MPAVEISNVTKTFGDVTAVDNLSLTVPEGSVYGFIGPNGSGKSTTMRMIANIFYPDSGAIQVFGKTRSGTRSAEIGYLPEERGVYRKMKVRALLEFYGELRGGRNVTSEVNSWLDRLGLPNRANDKVETLSKGMSQKVQFIATVIPEPKLLILDEPFTGLDPVSADSIRGAVLEMRKRGCTDHLKHPRHERGRKLVRLDFHDLSRQESARRIARLHPGELWKRHHPRGGRRTRPRLGELPGIERINDLGQVQELRMAPGCDPAASPPHARGPRADRLIFRGAAFASRYLRPHRRPAAGGGARCVESC